jgi:hypothetical protein
MESRRVFLSVVGWAIVIIGVIAALWLAFTMKTPETADMKHYYDLHPHRWYYALGTVIPSAVAGLILVGISDIIAVLSGKKNEQHVKESA